MHLDSTAANGFVAGLLPRRSPACSKPKTRKRHDENCEDTQPRAASLRCRLAELPFPQVDAPKSGIVGWSEFDEGFGSPGITAVIERLAARVVGQNAFSTTSASTQSYIRADPAGGRRRRREGLGAIENALLDAKAKALGVPCYELLGGKIRDRVRVYWSHCATWRINHPDWYKPAITDLDGVKAIGAEARERGFTALKTNIFPARRGRPAARLAARLRRAVPARDSMSRSEVLRNLRTHLEAIRDGAGPDMDLLLDLNFNAKTEGYLKILRAIADLDMFWIEIDSYDAEALGYIRRHSPHPDQLVRDIAGLARIPAVFPRTSDGCRDHRRGVERRLAIDEDRRLAPRRTRSTSRRIISTATSAP